MADETIVELLKRARDGDPDALNQLHDRYGRWVIVRLRQLGISDRDVEDVSQEVWLKFFRYFRVLGSKLDYPTTYLHRIITTVAIDYLRGEDRNPARLNEIDISFADQAAGLPVSTDDQLALREAIRQLPKEYRQAVILKDLMDLGFDEVSVRLNISLSNAKKRVTRGRKMLEKLFRK